MTLIRLWVTLQFAGATVLLLTFSGRVGASGDGNEGVRFSNLAKTIDDEDRTGDKLLQPFYQGKLVELEQRGRPEEDGRELSDDNLSMSEWDYQKDDTKFASPGQIYSGQLHDKFLTHGHDKRGWEGINFNGKRTPEIPISPTDKKIWEGINYNDKRGWEGIHFNGKRKENQARDMTQSSKRGWEGIYSGKKRSSSIGKGQSIEEIRGYRATKKGWEGLLSGKRGWEGLLSGKRGWEAITSGKRGWEGIIGKRGWEGLFGKRGWEGIIGKRGWEGLFGKRGWEGISGKRSELPFARRGWEGFIPGKRGWEGLHNSCSCCQGEQLRSCCSPCDQSNSSRRAINPPSRADLIRDIVCSCCDRVEVPSCCDVCHSMRQKRS